MQEIFFLGLAGALGAMARYWLSSAAYGLLGREYPWGTTTVNVLGSFLFGLVWALTHEVGAISPQARVFILVGFLGSFTTFSTYIFETHLLFQEGKRLKPILNLIVQNLISLAALYCGYLLGRLP
ncbi:fluoride efflux transporter CrcB [Desulfonatronum sp. SC1]|uniref:fluoride efflux transporter CrcB n=1 Tax=Desulfonatronum sp. SC1 TaxID=2109626 RepID=UPI000D2FDD02|nr:fluoride efflux transporter CrcB [Desulfonatronum sp. SC1]PTN37887.1 fluoride efflux transporter CrcB [Desulfonatronum sp. SC1]